MQQYLVKYRSIKNGVIEVEGLAILTEQYKQRFFNLYKFPKEYPYSSENKVIYENRDQLIKDYVWNEITSEQSDLIIRLIGKYFGRFYFPEDDEYSSDYAEE